MQQIATENRSIVQCSTKANCALNLKQSRALRALWLACETRNLPRLFFTVLLCFLGGLGRQMRNASLRGSFPGEIGRFTQLVFLCVLRVFRTALAQFNPFSDLSLNQIEGTIPVTIGDAAKLKGLCVLLCSTGVS